MLERMGGRKCQFLHFLQHRAIGLIVHGPTSLVLYDVALSVELTLRHCCKEFTHPIRFQPECERQLVRRDGLEVVGAFEPRRSVQRATCPLDQLEMFVRTDMGRSLEEHVLEKMREPGAAGSLVRRSDMIPEIHRHDWRGVVFGQCYEQSVVETERFYRNS